jgi:hypothetical protein
VAKRTEHDPNDDVPAAGRYELLNVFGTPTGETAGAGEGERLPPAPRGFRWRLVAEDEPLDVARRRVAEAERRVARQESLIEQMERQGRPEIAEIGRTLLRALRASLRAAQDHVERLREHPTDLIDRVP